MKSSHSYHKHSVQALIFLMGMILFPLQGLSQTSTTNPTLGGPQIEYDPTPKALEMTRYGQIPVNGNSGQITFEIPLYTYSDQDFNIPVSLSYASSGFMPGKQTGEAGLGWTLMAGGAITRDIIGVDDFYAYGGRHSEHKTFSDQTLYSLGYTISYPAVSNETLEPSVSGTYVETTSDIYHFSFTGHSGSFVLGGDCSFHAYDTSSGLGTYSIEHTTGGGFIITTADGYRYNFGSGLSSREYLVNRDPMADSPGQALEDKEKPIVTWLLDKITAPDGRIVEFSYAKNWTSTLYSLPGDSNTQYDVVTSIAPSLEKNLGTLGKWHKSASLKYTTYLSGISVRESSSSTPNNIASFSWEYKPSSEMGAETRAIYTKLAVPTKRLTGVTFSDSGRTLRTVSLTYTVNGTRSLLSQVSLSGIGTYSLSYLLDSAHPLPGLTCDGVDFWGYWNGKTVSGDELHLETLTYVDSLYNEYPSQSSDALWPDWHYSRLGTLHEVTYPTGGSTVINCEAATASRMLLRRATSESLEPHNPYLPDEGGGVSTAFTTDIYPTHLFSLTECGGVRVASTTDYDATGGPNSTRTYTYSGGVIQEFNRYILGKAFPGSGITMYNHSIHYPGSTFDRLHVAYGSVAVREPDGARSVEEFCTWDDFPDSYSVNRVASENVDPTGYDAYDLLLDNVMREPDSRHYRRGLPKRTRLYSPSGFLLEDRQYTYTDIGNGYAAYVVGSGQYWWSARRFICDRKLASESITEYFPDGPSLVTTRQYSYDSLGRQTGETVISHDGRTTTKSITYDVNTLRKDLPAKEIISEKERNESGNGTITQSADYHYSTMYWGPRVLSSYTKRLHDSSGASASSGGMALTDTVSFSSFDRCGNPRQQEVNSLVTSLVWGHSGRYPVAIVKGVAYSSLPASVKDASLLTGNLSSSQVSALRSLSGSEVTVWDYIPSVGASRCVSPSGRISTFTYDQYGRLSSISLAGQTITSYIYDTQQRGNTYLKYIQKTTHGGNATGNGTGSGLGLPSGDLVSRVIYDGLGREWITAEGPASGSGSSAGRIVTITGYDACGRKASEYLPYRISSSTVGLYSPVSAQSSWWDTYAGSGEGQYASVRHGYDNSLSPRSTWTVSPGSAFADGTHAARETVSSNATGEVASLRYDESTGSVSVLGMMPAGTLRRTTTVSPDGDSTRVFTDARGITILERRFGEGGTENDTYFVPDRQGRVVWTISPQMASQVTTKARQGLTPSYDTSDEMVQQYAYITTFDSKGDPQSAKVPGASVHAVTYDSRHLPVRDETPLMEGTYFHRFQNYDALGRPSFSFLADSSRVDVIQPALLYSLQANTINAIGPIQQLEGIWDLAGTSYGQAVSNPYSGVQASHAFSSLSGIATSYSTDVAGDVTFQRFNVVESVFRPLVIVDPAPLLKGELELINNNPVSVDAASTIFYYDDLGRVVQQVTLWPDGGLSRSTFRRDLRGNVLDSVEEFDPDGTASTYNNNWIWSSYAYDDFGNVVSSSRRAGTGQPSSFGGQILVSASYTYDGIGRLSGSSLSTSSSPSGSPSISSAFDYTVQGWLASSQVSLNTAANGPEPLFGETLRYWDPSQGSGATPRYGGMVSSKDIGRGLGWGRTEGYTYDPLGRLSRVAISATSPASGGSAVSSAERFTYDAAGNILSIRRNEGTGASKALNLSYSGNLLSSVSDSLAGSSYSYLHGKAGTVTSDGRIGRTMAMNVIGKVARVNGTVILNDMLQYTTLARYTYLSDGTKISVLDPSDSSYVLYRGPFLMRKDSTGTVSLECITVPEGIIVPDGNSLKMITFVKDCLGSVRSVVDLSGGTVLERNDYYAYGERVADSTMQTTSINRWRYNAKEEQDSIASIPYLDYGARLYDPVIGRWMQQDPMAEKYPHLSPYNFCGDNPVNYVDPDGKERRIVFNRKKRTITVYATYYYPAMESRVNKAVISAVNSYNNLKNTSYDNNGITYSVKFRLSLKPYYSKKQLNISPEDNLSSPANVIQTKHLRGLPKTQDGHQILGYVTGDKMNSIVLTTDTENSIIAAHEIGHTLGATDKETNDDFMYKFADNNTDFLLSQETINEIIENGFGVNEEQSSIKERFFSIIENLFKKKEDKIE